MNTSALNLCAFCGTDGVLALEVEPVTKRDEDHDYYGKQSRHSKGQFNFTLNPAKLNDYVLVENIKLIVAGFS